MELDITIAKEVLESQILKVPSVDIDKDYLNYLEKSFNEYNKKIEKLANKDFSKKSLELCDKLKWSVRKYFKGNTLESYNIFVEGIEKVKKEIIESISIKDSNKEFTSYKRFFRLRTDSNEKLVEKDLFHIPFNQRNKISNKRFSINGMPCLYFGGSPYICWEEFNRPGFDKFNIVRYEIKKEIKVLNISTTPAYAMYHVNNKCKDSHEKEKYLKNYLSILPLIFACSVKINKDDVFHSEYILPQLLLQWVLNNKDVVDAIRYISTKQIEQAQITKYRGLFTNYVFVTKYKSDSDEKYDNELLSKFKMTEVLYSKDIFILDNKIQYKPEEDLKNRTINIFGNEVPYYNTLFGYIEKKLMELQPKDINI